MAKPPPHRQGLILGLADAGKGTVAKLEQGALHVGVVLPTLEKELWQSGAVCGLTAPHVLPTLEKELWQSSCVARAVEAGVLPTLEKELWQSAGGLSW